MRKITLGILVLALIGCKNFETKKVSSEEILQEQLKHFSWSQVDTYPSFETCGEQMEKPALKKCFEEEMTRYIYREISEHLIVSTDSINETLRLYLVISNKGIPKVDSLAISEKLQQQVPQLKSWIEKGLENLPKIYPARTRGIPVATKFVLPVRVVSE